MADSFRIIMPDLPRWRAALLAAPVRLHQEVFTAARRISFRGSGLSTQYAPVWQGNLHNTIYQSATQSGDGVAAIWGASAGYAAAVDFGSRPHFPPVDAVAAWAEAHGIDPFVLARSISRKGTKAHPFVSRAYKELTTAAGFAHSEIVAAIKRTLASLAGGR